VRHWVTQTPLFCACFSSLKLHCLTLAPCVTHNPLLLNPLVHPATLHSIPLLLLRRIGFFYSVTCTTFIIAIDRLKSVWNFLAIGIFSLLCYDNLDPAWQAVQDHPIVSRRHRRHYIYSTITICHNSDYSSCEPPEPQIPSGIHTRDHLSCWCGWGI
jgi:hypothetical protein